MPPGVIVVKRRRRRAFAVVWAVPAWIRSLFAGPRVPPPLPDLPPESTAEDPRASLRLVEGADGEAHCARCGARVAVREAERVDPSTLAGWPRAAFRPDEAARLGCLRCLDLGAPSGVRAVEPRRPPGDATESPEALPSAGAREDRVA